MKQLMLATCVALGPSTPTFGQQVPNAISDIPISARNRFYTSDQFSNTVSVGHRPTR